MLESGEHILIRKVDYDKQLKALELVFEQLSELKQLVRKENTEKPMIEWGNNWHSISFVSSTLNIEPATLKYWARIETIEKKKIGQKVFINIEDVYLLLNSKTELAKVVPQLNRKKRKVS